MTPAAHNRFFGTQNFPYFVPSTTDWVQNIFTQVEPDARAFWLRMGTALVLAILTARAGFSWGDWLRKVRR